jgi:glycosyltransferase involved in cell wall biosynthesis
MRVALLTNVLSPYRLPVFRELAHTPGWSLRVFVCTRSELHWADAHARAYEDGRRELDVCHPRTLTLTRRISLNADTAARQRIETHWPIGLPGALRRFRPDVIVASELGPRCAIGAAAAAWLGIPLVIWSYHSRSAARAVPPLQRAWRRALLRRARAVVGMGRQAREVLIGYGVPPSRIFDAPNAHDHETLERALAEVEPFAAHHALRATTGAREHVALVVGRLVEAKGAHALLDHWLAVPAAARSDWSLVFVGDGPLEERVRQAAREHPGEIAHCPAVAPEGMAMLYAASDLLVFPSLGDPWGLAVNEALACGLPVVCSRLAGCADDLIEPGRNGWLYDPTDASDAARMLTEALRSRERERMGVRARETGKRFGAEAMAEGFRDAIRCAAEAQPGSER